MSIATSTQGYSQGKKYIATQGEVHTTGISVLENAAKLSSELCRFPPKHCYWLLVASVAGTGLCSCHGNQYCGEGTTEVWAVLARWKDQKVWPVQSHPRRSAGLCRLHHQASVCLCEFDDPALHILYINSFISWSPIQIDRSVIPSCIRYNHLFFLHGQHYNYVKAAFQLHFGSYHNW